MNKKNGISLIVLVLTVIVSLILISAGIVAINHNIKRATLAKFMNDLKEVEDSFGSSLVTQGNSSFDGALREKNDITSLLNSKLEIKTALEEEILANGDAGEKFYIVDLNKIGIEKSDYGNGYDEEGIDIYVISANTLHAYYLKGLKIDDKYYFSIKYNEE